MDFKPIDSITPELVNTHSEVNIKNVEKTVNDLQFSEEKILVCGTGASSHPEFNPRFVTPSAMIKPIYISQLIITSQKKSILQNKEIMLYH